MGRLEDSVVSSPWRWFREMVEKDEIQSRKRRCDVSRCEKWGVSVRKLVRLEFCLIELSSFSVSPDKVITTFLIFLAYGGFHWHWIKIYDSYMCFQVISYGGICSCEWKCTRDDSEWIVTLHGYSREICARTDRGNVRDSKKYHRLFRIDLPGMCIELWLHFIQHFSSFSSGSSKS